MPQKRRREQPAVDTQLIEIFEDLADDNAEIRHGAARLLLTKFSTEHNPSQEQLDKLLKRLIRGSCSGRKAARLGFSVALTEILAEHTKRKEESADVGSYSVSVVIKIFNELTKTSGSVTGQETRDYCFGRLFGSEALIRSKILFTSDGDTESWCTILDLVYELAEKKVWLREECGWVLFNSLQVLKTVNDGQTYAQLLIDKAQSYNVPRSQEGVAIWIACQQAFPVMKMPKHVFHRGDPLHRKEKSTLGKILRASSTTNTSDEEEVDGDKAFKPTNGTQASNGIWFSKLHFAWDIVLSRLLKPDPKHCTFSVFWKEAVDEGLFALSSSSERKYWGFSLVQRYVTSSCPDELLPTLLGQNFGRSLVNHMASKDAYLHSIADETLKAIMSRANSRHSSAVIIINALIEVDPLFDKATKTKTLGKLLADADDATVEAVLPGLTQTFDTKDTETNSFSVRQTTADILVHVVRSRGFPSEDTTRLETQRNLVSNVLNCLCKQAFSRTADVKTRDMFQSRVMSCLTHTVSKDATDPALLPYYTLCIVRSLPGSAIKADSEVLNTIEGGWSTIEKIKSKEQQGTSEKNRTQIFGALKLLYVLTLLQAYSGDADAVNVIEDLQGCYKSLVKSTGPSDADTGGEVLVEVLLSFVSKPSLLFRRLASQVFTACTKTINQRALNSMLEILQAKEDSAGQNALFDGSSQQEEAEADDDVEMSDVDPSDVKLDSDAEASSSSPDASTGSRSTSAESIASDDEDDGELAAFNAKLAEALESKDDVSSDEDMDDDQMEALTPHLVAVFKERKELGSKKQEKKDAKGTMVHFKCRILELLDIYTKQETSNLLALGIVVPVLELIRDTRSKLVSEKACTLVRMYLKSYRLGGSEHPDDACLRFSRDSLMVVHTLALQEGSNAYGTACSQASLLFVKALLRNGGSIEKVLDVYATTEQAIRDRSTGSKARPTLIQNFRNWFIQAKKEGRIPSSERMDRDEHLD